jgi:hypothetical protein
MSRGRNFNATKRMQADVFFVHHTPPRLMFLNDAIMGDLAAFHVAGLVGREW